jgi:hypothetical protein
VRNIILACLVLTIASVSPVDARSHRRVHPSKPPAAQTTQTGDKTAAEKASADTDEALDKRMKSICRGC